MLIFKGGTFYCEIVLAESAAKSEVYAAEQLASELKKVSKTDIPVVNEGMPRSADTRIYIGLTEACMQAYPARASAPEGDAFYMTAGPGGLYLYGVRGKYYDAGTFYAVCEFLERFAGVKYIAADETVYTAVGSIEIPDDLDFYSKPDFNLRMYLAGSIRRYPQFAARMRVCDPYRPSTLPGGRVYPLMEGRQGHNYFELIPPEKYKDVHPEWFDLKAGELCFSNTALTDEIFEVMKEKIAAHPDSVFFPLSQNDTVDPCQCSRCKTEYQKYTVSGTMIRFVNRVANKIEAWLKQTKSCREIYLVAFAYLFSQDAPVVRREDGRFMPIHPDVVPAKNVYIYYTTYDVCYYHDFTDEKCKWNKQFSQNFYGWNYLSRGRLFIWTYSTNFSHYLYFFHNLGTLQASYRIFAKAGAYGILDQSAVEAEFMPFAELKTYLSSKLMWDTRADVGALTEEFISAYYKCAAKSVREFLRLYTFRLKHADDVGGYHLRLYCLPEEMFSEKVFDEEFIASLRVTLKAGFEEIERCGGDDGEIVKKRLMRLDIAARFLALMNSHKNCLKDDSDYIAGFLKDCRYCGVKKHKHRESKGKEDMLEEFKELIIKGEVLKY